MLRLLRVICSFFVANFQSLQNFNEQTSNIAMGIIYNYCYDCFAIQFFCIKVLQFILIIWQHLCFQREKIAQISRQNRGLMSYNPTHPP